MSKNANDNQKHKDWDRLMSTLPLWRDTRIGSSGWMEIRNPAARDSLIWYFLFQYYFEKAEWELQVEYRRGKIAEVDNV